MGEEVVPNTPSTQHDSSFQLRRVNPRRAMERQIQGPDAAMIQVYCGGDLIGSLASRSNSSSTARKRVIDKRVHRLRPKLFYPPRYGTPEKALLLRSAPKSTTLSKTVHPTRAPQMATSIVGTIFGEKKNDKKGNGNEKVQQQQEKEEGKPLSDSKKKHVEPRLM